jgi:hypothetical protein
LYLTTLLSRRNDMTLRYRSTSCAAPVPNFSIQRLFPWAARLPRRFGRIRASAILLLNPSTLALLFNDTASLWQASRLLTCLDPSLRIALPSYAHIFYKSAHTQHDHVRFKRILDAIATAFLIKRPKHIRVEQSHDKWY